MSLMLLVHVLGVSVGGVRGYECFNTEPTRGQCVIYGVFPVSVIENFYPDTNYTRCVLECTDTPTCVGIQWSHKDKLCHPLDNELATGLEKNGSDCLHFRRQTCKKTEETDMTTFSNFAFKGGMLVKGVNSEDNCKSMCSRWESCSAYSWRSIYMYTKPVDHWCYLHQEVPPNSGQKVTGNCHQGIKPRRFVSETWRSFIYIFEKEYSRDEKAPKFIMRILECAEFCSRLPTCSGITSALNTNEKNCIINSKSLPMYAKKTLT